MRSDDLAPLLADEPPQAVGFRQGVIVQWNPITAQNVVQVGGSFHTDLPILNTAEAGLLVPGDVVALLTTGQGAKSWWILGRVTVPNTAQAASALSAWAARGRLATADGTITFNSTTFGPASDDTGPTITDFVVGTSGSALVFITAAGGTADGSPATSGVKGVFIGFDLAGPTPLGPTVGRALGISVSWVTGGAVTVVNGAEMNATKVVPLQGLTPGTYTLTAQYRIGGTGTAYAQLRGLFAVPL